MLSLPHLVLLQYIKRKMQFLRDNPEYLTYSLEGYDINSDVRSIFGAKRIDDSVLWIQKNDFTYTPNYNLNALIAPNICVAYEGGSESIRVLGDYGGFEENLTDRDKKTYVKGLKFKGIVDEREPGDSRKDVVGNPIVSSVVKIRDRIFRYLKLENESGTGSWKIVGFKKSGDDDVLVVEPEMKVSDIAGQSFRVVSSVDSNSYNVSSSFDSVTIRTILTITGDPELAEMVSIVIRNILKSARSWLSWNGMSNAKISHSGLNLVQAPGDNPTWQIVFLITGDMVDIWLDSRINNIETMSIEIDGEQDYGASEEDLVVLLRDNGA